MAEDKKYVPEQSHCLHAGYGHPLLKEWQATATVHKANILYPIFVSSNDDAYEEIKALPGQYRWGVNKLPELLTPLVQKGLRSVIIFGVISDAHKAMKDGKGACATAQVSPVAKALKVLQSKYPDVLRVVDVCLCGYTDHGHCGILNDDGSINNAASIARIGELAAFYAQNGAQCVAPSDMMDSRIGAIKAALSAVNLAGKVSVMSYSAKFASVMYGPFREAAASGMTFGDRSNYQLPPASRGLALRALQRDLDEGADMVMIKPGGPYLDLVRDAKNMCNVPIAVYQVSGEYAMLYHAAKAGAFELKPAVLETLVGMRRAGADIIITYFAPQLMDWLSS